MGLGGGVECAAQVGYHMREADLYVEIIDPKTGRVLPDGVYGEVVFTTLTRRGMPLIRYRTGDISRLIPDTCPCGTHLKTLEKITHRLAGQVQINGETFTMADLDKILFLLDGVLDFRATVYRENENDMLKLDVKVIDESGSNWGQRLKEALLPLTSDVVVQIVPAIPASMAKRAIIDSRGEL